MPRLLAVLLLLSAAALRAGGFEKVAEEVRETVLANGLRVLVLPRHDAPVVSFFTLVGVGSADEKTGITGVAHVFEHMAFKGTRTIGTRDYAAEEEWLETADRAFEALRAERLKGPKADPDRLARLQKEFEAANEKAVSFVNPNEYTILYEKNGSAGLNAFTSPDMTGYMVSLPANKLELWFAVEAERFTEPVIREFYKEKEVILEERRMRTESNPMGLLWEELLAAAYKAHPYGYPTIGHKSDIENLTRAQAEAFYREHYTPEKTTVAIVGDVDPAETFRMAEAYFSKLPRRERPDPYIPPEPPQLGEKRVVVEAAHQPVVMIAHHMPAADHPDEAAHDALTEILGGGPTSRLHARLVKRDRLAVNAGVFSGAPGQRFPRLLIAYAMNAPGKATSEIEKAVVEEMDRLIADGVTQEEIDGFKRRARAGLTRSLRSNAGMARTLATAQLYYGDWRELFRAMEKIEKVTPEDVRRVAREILTSRSRVVGQLENAAGKEKR